MRELAIRFLVGGQEVVPSHTCALSERIKKLTIQYERGIITEQEYGICVAEALC